MAPAGQFAPERFTNFWVLDLRGTPPPQAYKLFARLFDKAAGYRGSTLVRPPRRAKPFPPQSAGEAQNVPVGRFVVENPRRGVLHVAPAAKRYISARRPVTPAGQTRFAGGANNNVRNPRGASQV